MSDRDKAIDSVRDMASALFDEKENFVAGMINGRAFIATVLGDRPPRVVLTSGIVVEVTVPQGAKA